MSFKRYSNFHSLISFIRKQLNSSFYFTAFDFYVMFFNINSNALLKQALYPAAKWSVISSTAG